MVIAYFHCIRSSHTVIAYGHRIRSSHTVIAIYFYPTDEHWMKIDALCYDLRDPQSGTVQECDT